MKRSHRNLNHPLLYKQGAMPPQVLSSHHINRLLRIKPSDSSVRFPSEGTLSLFLILIVYSFSRLRSIGSLVGIFVLNIGAVCGELDFRIEIKRRKPNLPS
ncbi:hypothetical protein PIB30_065498 [Stylosanthes scabra]|uniref:Uncharacterized protein n=1 Tax=Stylosanthes scabra TaxID=79078 RepID=A0ABU6UNQ5_9FABA|nr:hypothetical protein [Stylosanthes scabra]